jgi:hypothetical protein
LVYGCCFWFGSPVKSHNPLRLYQKIRSSRRNLSKKVKIFFEDEKLLVPELAEA